MIKEVEMKAFHECELKLKIDSMEMKDAIITRMKNNGYIHREYSLETDYILDTKMKDFDKQLFRVRKYSNKEFEDLIFTIKIKGQDISFQDNMEYEICASQCTNHDAENMKELVKNMTGIWIPEKLFFEKNIMEALDILKKFGFYIKRVIQKKRDVYVGEHAKILFDTFPKSVGTYLEIEAGSKQNLEMEVKRIGVEKLPLEKRNYGQIIGSLTEGKNRLEFD